MSDGPSSQPDHAPGRGQRGTIIREAHFPDRAPIEAYGNGGFRFAGMSHQGAIMCLRSGIYGWNAGRPADLTQEQFQRIVDEHETLELLLVGTGVDLVRIDRKIVAALAEQDVRVECMSTGAAVRTYNVLLSEGRAVGAALLPVD